MNSESFLSLAERFGLWAALCVSLIVAVLLFAWKRENRMAARIDNLEESSHASNVATAKALESNGACLRQIADLQQRQLDAQNRMTEAQQEANVEMRCRPCLRNPSGGQS